MFLWNNKTVYINTVWLQKNYLVRLFRCIHFLISLIQRWSVKVRIKIFVLVLVSDGEGRHYPWHMRRLLLGKFLSTFATLWANSADDKLIIFFSFFPEKWL